MAELDAKALKAERKRRRREEAGLGDGAQERDPLIAFVHIPKTAGGTLKSVFAAAFGRDAVHDSGNYLVNPEGVEAQPFKLSPKTKITIGHVPYSIFRAHLPADTRYITFLRDPVERVISHYYRHLAGRSGTLPELLRAGWPQVTNLMTRFVCGYSDPLGALPDTAVEDAKRTLESFAFVGFQDRFDESLVMLQERLIVPMTAYGLSRHVNETRPGIEEVGDHCVALIEEHNQLDLELYEWACTRFDTDFSSSADDLAAAVRTMRAESAAKTAADEQRTQRALRWLTEQLRPDDAHAFTELRDGAERVGLSVADLRRARRRMNPPAYKVKTDRGVFFVVVSESAAATAAQWLREQLPSGTSSTAEEILAAAARSGLGSAAVKRAADLLGIRWSEIDEEGREVWRAVQRAQWHRTRRRDGGQHDDTLLAGQRLQATRDYSHGVSDQVWATAEDPDEDLDWAVELDGEGVHAGAVETDAPLVVFVHIQKTAGKSLRQILRRQYPGSTRSIHVPNYFPKPADHWATVDELTAHRPPGLQVAHGHMLFVPDRWPRDARFVTILRDPVERTISHFFWLKERRGSRAGWSSIEDALDEKAIRDNLQVRVLSGADPSGPVTQTMAEEAIAALDRFTVVGLTSRFDESLVLFGRAFGWRTAVYERVNSTNSRAPREALDAATIERIEDHNRFDLELYDIAAKRFEELVGSQPDDFSVEVDMVRAAMALTPLDASWSDQPLLFSADGADTRTLIVSSGASRLVAEHDRQLLSTLQAQVAHLQSEVRSKSLVPGGYADHYMDKALRNAMARIEELETAQRTAKQKIARARRRFETAESEPTTPEADRSIQSSAASEPFGEDGSTSADQPARAVTDGDVTASAKPKQKRPKNVAGERKPKPAVASAERKPKSSHVNGEGKPKPPRDASVERKPKSPRTDRTTVTSGT